VPLGSALSRLLAEHKLGSRFSSPEDPLFASANGNPLSWRNVERRGMDRAVRDAGLVSVPGRRRPTLHDLRDTFASGLIEAGLDVVQVSRLMGHADPAITLRVYADLFNLARGAERALLAIDSAFGTALEPRGGDRRRTSVCTEAQITPIQAVSSTGGD
jgi:integrase